MSQINCSVAGDLIPLYVDEVLSADSVALVEEHLAECGDCAAKVQQLRGNTVVLRDKNIKPLRQIKGKSHRGNIGGRDGAGDRFDGVFL